MKKICEQFSNQQDDLYFYIGDEETKVPNYAFLKKHSQQVTESEDPFLNPRLFSKIEFKESYDAAILRTEKIFIDTQSQILNLLHRKKNHFTLQEYDHFVSNVKSVRLASSSDLKVQKISTKACLHPNAIYMRGPHKMLICPSLMNLPVLTLQKILAHEFGHAIQKVQEKISCFNKFPHKQVNEIFADWVASEVISQTLRSEKNRGLARKQALESQMLFLSLACFSGDKTQSAYYPTIRNRIENIFLAQSAFQDAFQCQNPGTIHCE